MGLYFVQQVIHRPTTFASGSIALAPPLHPNSSHTPPLDPDHFTLAYTRLHARVCFTGLVSLKPRTLDLRGVHR